MSKEFKVGDKVRIKQDALSGFLKEYSNKRRDRIAVIDHTYQRMGERDKSIRVLWLKRGNRGKEFWEHVKMSEFLKYWEAVCA